jgi:hypothetical protein
MKKFIIHLHGNISRDMKPWFSKLVAWPMTIMVFVVCCVILPVYLLYVAIAIGISYPIIWCGRKLKPLFFTKVKEAKKKMIKKLLILSILFLVGCARISDGDELVVTDISRLQESRNIGLCDVEFGGHAPTVRDSCRKYSIYDTIIIEINHVKSSNKKTRPHPVMVVNKEMR